MTHVRLVEFFDFGRLDLLRGHICWLAGVHANVLLQDQGIGEFLVTDWTLVQDPHWWLGPMDAHVSLQVAFGGEGPSANLALERSLTRVSPVVHLQCAFAAQHPVANDALVRIAQFVLDIVHQLLKLGRF